MFGTLNGGDGAYHAGLFIIAAVAAISFMLAIMFGNFIGAILPVIGNKRG